MSEHDMKRLLALVEKHLGGEWVEVVEFLRKQNQLPDLEERIRKRDFAGAIADVTKAADRFASSIHKDYLKAAEAERTVIDKQRPDSLVDLDVGARPVVEHNAKTRYAIRAALSEDTKAVVTQVVSDGLRRGVSPRDIARDLRDSIGLTPNQEQHVRNYRRALETGDYDNIVGRELHDDRVNGKIKKAFDDGKRLDPQYIDKLVERYRKKYVAYRAEVIARTEALRAVHEGTEEAMRQAIEAGDVDAESVTRTWHIGDGTRVVKRRGGKGKRTISRTRDSHRAMNGQQRKYGEAFTSGHGNLLRYPGDPSAPVSDTANCRCAVSSEIGEGKKREFKEMSTATLESERAAYTSELSKEQQDLLLWYSGDDGYKALNSSLRHGEKPTDDERAAIAKIDTALGKYKPPHDLVLYRGVGGDVAQAMLEGLKPGDKYTDQGYTSTTVDPEAQFGGARVIIEAGKKVTMAPIPSHTPYEYEMLLARGTTFRVLTVERVGASEDYIGRLTVRVRVE